MNTRSLFHTRTGMILGLAALLLFVLVLPPPRHPDRPG